MRMRGKEKTKDALKLLERPIKRRLRARLVATLVEGSICGGDTRWLIVIRGVEAWIVTGVEGGLGCRGGGTRS